MVFALFAIGMLSPFVLADDSASVEASVTAKGRLLDVLKERRDNAVKILEQRKQELRTAIAVRTGVDNVKERVRECDGDKACLARVRLDVVAFIGAHWDSFSKILIWMENHGVPQSEITAMKEYLAEKRAEIAAAETKEEVKAIIKEVNDKWGEYRTKVWMYVLQDKEDDAITRTEIVLESTTTLRASLVNRGFDVTAFDRAVANVEAKLDLVKADDADARTQWKYLIELKHSLVVLKRVIFKTLNNQEITNADIKILSEAEIQSELPDQLVVDLPSTDASVQASVEASVAASVAATASPTVEVEDENEIEVSISASVGIN